MKQVFLLLLLCCATLSCAQDSIKVHFLYGSTPKKEFSASEGKWFGGKLGGHVGIEFDSDKVIDFVPMGEFHKFPMEDEKHSTFAIRSVRSFWSMFSGKPDSVKKATFVIPISKAQRQKLDSIVHAYKEDTPYDYAFFGMRCGSAAYDILSQLDILPRYSVRKTSRKIFYPKKLRKRLFKKAEAEKWKVYMVEGSERRKWEN